MEFKREQWMRSEIKPEDLQQNFQPVEALLRNLASLKIRMLMKFHALLEWLDKHSGPKN